MKKYDCLNKQDALQRLNGNEVLYRKLLDRFEHSMVPILSGLHEAVTNQNSSEAKYFLHSAKGMASTIGADNLAKLCQSLERVATSESRDITEDDVQIILALHTSVLDEIKRLACMSGDD